MYEKTVIILYLLTIHFSGGYILFTITYEVYEPMKDKCEVRMQELHDAGQWKWMETKMLEKYSMSLESNTYAPAIKYLFQKL